MRPFRTLPLFFAAIVLIVASGSFARAQQPVRIAHTSLKAGDPAPDFTLLDHHWKPVHLSDYRGKKNVVLAFYVLAFTEA